ncbi:MAG TPA: hypothetical protein VIY68_04875 [Steroidobacteraceae bacterium]
MTGFSSNLTISIFVECWRVACAAHAGINGARRAALTRASRAQGCRKEATVIFLRATSRAQERIEAILQAVKIATHRSLGAQLANFESFTGLWLAARGLVIPRQKESIADCPEMFWKLTVPVAFAFNRTNTSAGAARVAMLTCLD